VVFSRALRTPLALSDSVFGVAVTADGKRAVSASDDKTLKVWDVESGLIIATFHCDVAPRCCAFVELERFVAGDFGGRVHVLLLEEAGTPRVKARA
jgi:WD40 repeat protein